jgi:DNA-binding winged helix-turn-helix (wHTH) protein
MLYLQRYASEIGACDSIDFMPEGIRTRFFFGTYEFDVATGELLHKSVRVRLPSQNARVLAILLENPGTVVGREDIRKRIWPDGDHLNHTHAINNCINQLRYILRDDRSDPEFIETLPKRGYRFVADVRSVEEIVAPPEELVASMPVEIEAAAEPVRPEPPAQVSTTRAEVAEPTRRKPRFLVAAACVVVVALLATGVIVWRRMYRPQPTAPADLTLGIAPFTLTGKEAQSIGEAFRLEVADAASQLPGVQVRATHSMSALGGDATELKTLPQLQLGAVLTGSIASNEAGHLTFDFELLRGSDAVHLAAFHYEGSQAELSSISRNLQRDLFFRLSDTQRNHLNPIHSTNNPKAYSEYLAGRAALVHPTDEAIGQAIALLRDVTQEDPGFAQAWAALGSAYLLQAEHSLTRTDGTYSKARQAAQRAVQLDPLSAEAHATLGFLEFRHDWNAVGAERELKQAITLDSGQAMYHVLYALLLVNSARFDEAFREVDLAHAADPRWPPVFLTDSFIASADRRNLRALQAAHDLLQIMPDWPLAHDQNAWAFWYAGKYEDAVHEWMRMATIEHDTGRLALEQQGLEALHSGGVIAYAKLKLAAAMAQHDWKHPNDFQLAEWQLNAGLKQEGLASLQAMVKAHEPDSLPIATSPAYFSLHGDPQFAALVRQIH